MKEIGRDVAGSRLVIM